MAIQNLSSVSSLDGGESVALFSATIGNDVRASIAVLVAYLQASLTSGSAPMTQYSAPSATGFSVTVLPVVTGGSVWLLLTPAAGYAAGTIVMPASPVDGQTVQVSCTQAVATLTVSGNGKTINNAPASLAAGGTFGMRYDGVFQAWYRIN